MISKDLVIASIRREIRIIMHLATCVPEGRADYRPTEGQRTILELLRHLATCASVPTKAAIAGSWDGHSDYVARSADVTPETFAEAMQEEQDELVSLIEGLSAEDLAAPAKLPWNEVTTVAEMIFAFALPQLVAYRMQLFLYAKQAGNADIDTVDCWYGAKGG